jgi:flavin-dependent dehydrogenase
VAIEATRRGMSVAVLERASWPVDKACGEGLMPAGLAALERLGVLPFLDRDDTAVFERIVWTQENGRTLSAQLPAPGGLGVRRTALSQAMASAARAAGADLRPGVTVTGHRAEPGGVVLDTSVGEVTARVVVAADGLNSAFRRRTGVERPWDGARRYGLRQHLAIAPWDRAVEVHFARGVEAYVTPAGRERVGIAFLWEPALLEAEPSFAGLLAHFPALERRLGGCEPDSKVRGAGPLRRPVTRRSSDRVVLLGDAAGYVDAITGEGLSLAFEAAGELARVLPEALAQGAGAATFAGYERASDVLFRRYARLAGLLVWTARHHVLRRCLVDALSLVPPLFGVALRLALPRSHRTSLHEDLARSR